MPTVVAPGGGVGGRPRPSRPPAPAGGGAGAAADVDRAEVDLAVVGRRVDLHHQRAHVVVGRARPCRAARPSSSWRGSRCGPSRRSATSASADAERALLRGDLLVELGRLLALGREDEHPVGAHHGDDGHRDEQDGVSAGHGISLRWSRRGWTKAWRPSWPSPAGWPSSRWRSSRRRPRRRPRRSRCRRSRRRARRPTVGLLEEDDDLEARGRALAARADRRAGGSRRSAGVGLLGLGEAHAGDALDVAQAGHQARRRRAGSWCSPTARWPGRRSRRGCRSRRPARAAADGRP